MQVYKILQRIAAQANTHLAPDQHITVSPHVLRHTLLDGLAEGKGVQYAKEQCGHRSDRYIWLYMKPSTQALADALA